jgi:hypothetical protein
MNLRRERGLRAALGVLWTAGYLMTTVTAAADGVTSRFREGATHGFLVLRSTDNGKTLAYGELLAVPQGDRVQNRLTWRFLDGSLQDERTVYTQQPVLKLLSYRQVQRGPTFPADVEVSFARDGGRYEVRRQEKGKKQPEVVTGTVELPDDVYNGMALTVVKNLARGATGTGHMLVFTPKPRLIKMTMRSEGEDPIIVGEARRTATRYLIDLEVGGIAGIFAAVAGKKPPDLRYWLLLDEAPAFVKFEGPFFQDGGLWRIELTAPRWPK